MSAVVPVADVIARELRASLGRLRLTHADLARAAELPPRTVDRVMTGDANISLDHFAVLVAGLDGSDPAQVVRDLVGQVRAHSGLRMRP